MDGCEFMMIDHSIEIDTSSFPRLLQNVISDLEKYDAEGDWVMYDGLADGLESFAKSALIAGEISNSQFNKLMTKYIGVI